MMSTVFDPLNSQRMIHSFNIQQYGKARKNCSHTCITITTTLQLPVTTILLESRTARVPKGSIVAIYTLSISYITFCPKSSEIRLIYTLHTATKLFLLYKLHLFPFLKVPFFTPDSTDYKTKLQWVHFTTIKIQYFCQLQKTVIKQRNHNEWVYTI